jgi:hypothetical protein
MSGPFALTDAEIERAVSKSAPGAYTLGSLTNNNRTVLVGYAGRADVDLAARLKDHVGKYAAFTAAYASSPLQAFLMECELFHEYKPTDNRIHPARPKNSDWKCPRCNNFS